jgi:hypothetical protein
MMLYLTLSPANRRLTAGSGVTNAITSSALKICRLSIQIARIESIGGTRAASALTGHVGLLKGQARANRNPIETGSLTMTKHVAVLMGGLSVERDKSDFGWRAASGGRRP